MEKRDLRALGNALHGLKGLINDDDRHVVASVIANACEARFRDFDRARFLFRAGHGYDQPRAREE